MDEASTIREKAEPRYYCQDCKGPLGWRVKPPHDEVVIGHHRPKDCVRHLRSEIDALRRDAHG